MTGTRSAASSRRGGMDRLWAGPGILAPEEPPGHEQRNREERNECADDSYPLAPERDAPLG